MIKTEIQISIQGSSLEEGPTFREQIQWRLISAGFPSAPSQVPAKQIYIKMFDEENSDDEDIVLKRRRLRIRTRRRMELMETRLSSIRRWSRRAVTSRFSSGWNLSFSSTLKIVLHFWAWWWFLYLYDNCGVFPPRVISPLWANTGSTSILLHTLIFILMNNISANGIPAKLNFRHSSHLHLHCEEQHHCRPHQQHPQILKNIDIWVHPDIKQHCQRHLDPPTFPSSSWCAASLTASSSSEASPSLKNILLSLNREISNT